MKQQIMLSPNLADRIPKGFRLSNEKEGLTEIILDDQEVFLKWDEIFPIIKEEHIVNITLYHPEDADLAPLEIQGGKILPQQNHIDTIGIKFKKTEISKECFKVMSANPQVFHTKRVFDIFMSNVIFFHKGMLRSVSF